MRANALFSLLLLAACAGGGGYRDTDVAIASKALFEPAKYAGTWYEIARFPVPYEKGCTKTTATYTPARDGSFDLVNSCVTDGVERRIEGSAKLVGPGRLEVSFDGLPFVKAPYWVLWTDEDYETAVVGVPSGSAGWILNRTPQIRADRLQAARDVLEFNGYDLSKLMMVPQ
jgi:apolipoprotein D and lipocalin family protein